MHYLQDACLLIIVSLGANLILASTLFRATSRQRCSNDMKRKRVTWKDLENNGEVVKTSMIPGPCSIAPCSQHARDKDGVVPAPCSIAPCSIAPCSQQGGVVPGPCSIAPCSQHASCTDNVETPPFNAHQTNAKKTQLPNNLQCSAVERCAQEASSEWMLSSFEFAVLNAGTNKVESLQQTRAEVPDAAALRAWDTSSFLLHAGIAQRTWEPQKKQVDYAHSGQHILQGAWLQMSGV